MNPNAIFIITIAMLGVATIYVVTDAIDKNESKYIRENDSDKFRRQAALVEVAIENEEDSNDNSDFSVFESYYNDGINSTNHTIISANNSASFLDLFSENITASNTIPTTTPIEYSSESETNKIFYFAITHSSNTDRGLVNASIATWCRRVVGRPVVWYSNKAQAGVDHVISFDGEDSTENITFRMAAVWRHVAQNYGGYEWYARFWDDNYVVVKDFEDIIKGHNPNLPIEIGRLADFSTNQLIRVGEERNHPLSALLYVDGGAGSMLSREAMRRLTVGMDICIEEVDPKVFTCAWRCEDVIFGHCMRTLFDVQFFRSLGMYHGNTAGLIERFSAQMRAHEPFDGEDRGEASVVRTMHWVRAEEMRMLDAIFYP